MTVSAEDNDTGRGWAQSDTPAGNRGHVCNCIGCCRKCGSCRTAPWHTAEYCKMKIRHAAELAELVRKQTADGITPGLEYGTY